MGCTNDVINMKCKKKEDISTFMDMFNQLLYDDLYYGKYDLEDIEIEKEEECYHIFFEDEPMFRRAEGGNIIENFVKEFITKNPTIHFSLDYFCSYTNCGDVLNLEYIYDGNKVFVKEISAEQEGIYMCSECEEDFDKPLAYFDDYDDKKDYLCPICGAKNTLEIYKREYELTLE